jgi:hypothetical protein
VNQTALNRLARQYRETLGERYPALRAVVERHPRRK